MVVCRWVVVGGVAQLAVESGRRAGEAMLRGLQYNRFVGNDRRADSHDVAVRQNNEWDARGTTGLKKQQPFVGNGFVNLSLV